MHHLFALREKRKVGQKRKEMAKEKEIWIKKRGTMGADYYVYQCGTCLGPTT